MSLKILKTDWATPNVFTYAKVSILSKLLPLLSTQLLSEVHELIGRFAYGVARVLEVNQVSLAGRFHGIAELALDGEDLQPLLPLLVLSLLPIRVMLLVLGLLHGRLLGNALV